MKHYFKYYLAGLIFLLGCTAHGNRVDRIEKHIVIKTFKVRPVSVHDAINPRYRAILSNGDTVPCGVNRSIGDTITYIYYDTNTIDSSDPR